MKRKGGVLLQGTKQLNSGAIVSGVGFLLYLLARALGWGWAADMVALVFSVVALYVLASVAAGRRRDKETVSYNLLWGQTALAVLLGMCAVLTIREKLGR